MFIHADPRINDFGEHVGAADDRGKLLFIALIKHDVVG